MFTCCRAQAVNDVALGSTEDHGRTKQQQQLAHHGMKSSEVSMNGLVKEEVKDMTVAEDDSMNKTDPMSKEPSATVSMTSTDCGALVENSGGGANATNALNQESSFEMKDGILMFGPYEVKRTLGKGMQAKVKLAKHSKTGELVALKVVDKGSLSKRHMIQIQREVQALATVHHPNILGLRFVVEDARLCKNGVQGTKSVFVMVLDLAAGGEIFDLMLYTGHFSEVLARTYFVQMASALQACHHKGIFHRDIKPENILLDSNFQLKIADFGLSAIHHDGNDVCNTYCGTRSYMSPETLAEKPYNGAKADVWAVGIVLFIMLAGSPPMRMANTTDWWFKAVLLGRYDKFWEAHERVCPYFPKAAQAFINRILVADEKQRLSMDEIMEHPWVKGEILTPQQLFRQVSERKDSANKRKALEREEEIKKQQEAAYAAAAKHDPFKHNTHRSANLPMPPTKESSFEPMVNYGGEMYLYDPDPINALERLGGICEEMGAKVKSKPDAWEVKALFPSEDGAQEPAKAELKFRFFLHGKENEGSDSVELAPPLLYIDLERISGDVFAVKELCAKVQAHMMGTKGDDRAVDTLTKLEMGREETLEAEVDVL